MIFPKFKVKAMALGIFYRPPNVNDFLMYFKQFPVNWEQDQ